MTYTVLSGTLNSTIPYHTILNLFVKELPNFMRKYYLITDHRTPMTKYLFPIQRCLLESLVWKWRCVVRTRSTFSRSVMVSVAVSSLGRTDLFFIDWQYKGERRVLLRCFARQQLLPAICDLSGDFFTFQQLNAPVHRARETMQLLTYETPDFIAAALASQ